LLLSIFVSQLQMAMLKAKTEVNLVTVVRMGLSVTH
jgi:hypothetical protein